MSMRDVVDVVARLAAERWAGGAIERQDVAWKHAADGRDLSAFSRGEGPGEQVKLVSDRATARLEAAGVTAGLSIETRKPEWLRPKVELGAGVTTLRKTIRELGLVTVCEDAGCPNLSRVLGRRHGDVHGARRAVHAGLRVLPRRHEQAARTRRPTNLHGSPRRSTGWRSTTRCSRWSPATISPTAAWPTSPPASRRSASAVPAPVSRR